LNCQYSTTAANAAPSNFNVKVGAVEAMAHNFYQNMWDYVDEHYDKKGYDVWPFNGESILPDMPDIPNPFA